MAMVMVLVVIDADNDTAKTHAGRENEEEQEKEDEEEEEEDDNDTTDDRVILKAVVTHSHRFPTIFALACAGARPRRNHDLAYQHVGFVASGL